MFKVASVFVWRHGGLLIDAVITSISDAAAPRGAMSRQGQRQERNGGQAAARGLWRGTDLTRIVLRGDAGGYRETQPPHTSGLHSVSEPARGGDAHRELLSVRVFVTLCLFSQPMWTKGAKGAPVSPAASLCACSSRGSVTWGSEEKSVESRLKLLTPRFFSFSCSEATLVAEYFL